MSTAAQPGAGERPPGDARELILARVRAAIAGPGEEAPAPFVRSYRRHGLLEPQARIALLCERIDDYRAQVQRVSDGELGATIAAVLADHDAHRVAVPAAIPPSWRPAGVDFVEDTGGLAFDEFDRLDAVLTGATLAIAETGTVVLTAGPLEGRRALTLIPDLHVCVVGEEQVVETVPEAMEALGELVRTQRRPITLISGPSATSDIELSRVEGVHGPRRLVVLVVRKESR
jgi:L-lactate dehydrogenase complex protein LldG